MPVLSSPQESAVARELNSAGLWRLDGSLEMTSVHPSRMPHPIGWGEGRCCWTRRWLLFLCLWPQGVYLAILRSSSEPLTLSPCAKALSEQNTSSLIDSTHQVLLLVR